MPEWLNKSWFRAAGVTAEPLMERKWTRALFSDELVRATRFTLPHLLRYEDRNSMHFSIESRVPFLTPEIANFCVSVPEEYNLGRDGTRKTLFREAMRGIVPDQILDRKDKIAFATPESGWLRRLSPWVESVLAKIETLEPSPFDFGCLQREWQAVLSGNARSSWHVWRCLNLAVWVRRHAISTDVAG